MRLRKEKLHPGKTVFSAFLLILLLVQMILPALASTPTDAYVNDDEIIVRTGPGRSYAQLTILGDSILLYRGQYVRIIDSQKGSDGHTWYHINFRYLGYSKLGYMRDDYVTVLSGDEDFCQYLNDQGFPKSYQPYLRALYAASGHKWTFVANQTGISWNKALEMESTLGVSLVSGSNTALRATVPGAYDNGVWKQFEPGWYAASKEAVAFYMDPRTYLIDGTCLTFELLSGNDSVTHEQLAKVLSGCAWATGQIIDEFLRAGKEADVSPFFLAIKAKNELGNAATKNASGYEIDGVKYYNFFNIGAYGGPDPNYEGIKYAKSKGWDTSYKALLGGAKFIASSYIASGQNTQYLQRFNLTDTSTFTHQYATDITYAYKGGWGLYKSYRDNGLLDMPLILSVPIFEGMPEYTKLPSNNYEEEYIPPDENPKDPDPQPGPNPNPNPGGETEKPVTYDYVSKLSLTRSGAYVSGFKLGAPVSDLVKQIQAVNPNATVTVKNSKGAVVDGKASIGTGYVLSISDAAGTVTYTCILYGDANGDGKIAATDLLVVKRHILKTEVLTGASAKAATIKNSQIGATSLLAIKKHILGTASIVQK